MTRILIAAALVPGTALAHADAVPHSLADASTTLAILAVGAAVLLTWAALRRAARKGRADI